MEAANKFSPKEFLRKRRPEKFSDSIVEETGTLDRAFLEYYLSSLNNRSQELQFESFSKVFKTPLNHLKVFRQELKAFKVLKGFTRSYKVLEGFRNLYMTFKVFKTFLMCLKAFKIFELY